MPYRISKTGLWQRQAKVGGSWQKIEEEKVPIATRNRLLQQQLLRTQKLQLKSPHEEKTTDLEVLSQEECTKRLQQYEVKEVIGEGSYDKVVKGCKKEQCRYAIKIQPYDEEDKNRDVYFLKVLQDATYGDNQRLVPLLVETWLCGTSQYIVMDRYDGDMEEGHGRVDEDWVFEDDDLLKLFQIAWKLGKLGVIGGDLKPNQYLWKWRGKRSQKEVDIAVTDFGFSGWYDGKDDILPLIGFSSKLAPGKCGQAFDVIRPCGENKCSKAEGEKYSSAFNVLQLQGFLIASNAKVRVANKIYPFTFISDIPTSVNIVCKEYDRVIQERMENLNAEKPDWGSSPTYTWADLIS